MLYPVAIEPGDDQYAFSVVVPDIEGCFSAGDTFKEALENAKEAIHLQLEGFAEEGRAIPEGSPVDVHYNNPEYKGWIWAVAEVDVSHYLGKAQKINVTLPDLLIKQIDDRVDEMKTYKSRSGFLQQAAMKELNKV